MELHSTRAVEHVLYCLHCFCEASPRSRRCRGCGLDFTGSALFDLLEGPPPSTSFAWLFRRGAGRGHEGRHGLQHSFGQISDDMALRIHLPECSDGQDNDDDGRVDFLEDRQCTSAGDESERRRN